jgi:hypothetical protein
MPTHPDGQTSLLPPFPLPNTVRTPSASGFVVAASDWLAASSPCSPIPAVSSPSRFGRPTARTRRRYQWGKPSFTTVGGNDTRSHVARLGLVGRSRLRVEGTGQGAWGRGRAQAGSRAYKFFVCVVVQCRGTTSGTCWLRWNA